MANEDLSEDELFDGAVSDEAADTPAVTEQTEQQEQPEQAEKPAPDQTEMVAATEATAKAAVDDNAPLVPSWRLREINEEKRTLADRLAALEAERSNWQRQQAPQPQQAAEKAGKPDPLLDPEGYAKSVREEIRNDLLNERREESLLRAREANQGEFDEAYAAAQKAVDPALKARMQSSRDPGKTLLEWHRENKVRAEIGNDLVAYKQRQREEALKDPEFRKAAMAAWAAEAQPATSGRPRVELPPSLNGASRSNAALRASQADVSDDALWDEATA